MTQSVSVEESVVLSLSEWHVTDDTNVVLMCLGLGSCVALCLHDPIARVGGMAHMVLPDSSSGRVTGPSAKFVDLAIPMLVEQMREAGAIRSRLRINIVGGARMLSGPAFAGTLDVGARNLTATRSALESLRLSVNGGEEVGGTHGRTVRLHVGSGDVAVSTAGGNQS